LFISSSPVASNPSDFQKRNHQARHASTGIERFIFPAAAHHPRRAPSAFSFSPVAAAPRPARVARRCSHSPRSRGSEPNPPARRTFVHCRAARKQESQHLVACAGPRHP
jgi:hypothetical protein